MNILKTIAGLLCLSWAWAVVPAHAANASGDLAMTATVGLGYDSNVYLTPKAPYVDLAQPGNPYVVPKVQSGLFVPLGFDLKTASGSGTEFHYAFDGNLYVNSALSNASTYDHIATLGWNTALDHGGEFYWGFLGGYHRQIYFDRDTGLAKLSRISGTNISNRYNHFDFGMEAKYQQKVDDVEYKLDSKLVMKNYSDPVVVAPLDHLLFELGGSARFPLGSDATKLKVGYNFRAEKYSSRAARDAAGVQSAANGLLTYYYHTGSIQLFHKFSRNFMTFLDYEGTYRSDNYVSYNNYFKNKVKLRLVGRLSRDVAMRLKVAYSKTSYPHAFAFNTAAGGKKTYKKLYASLQGEYELTGASKLWVRANYTNQDSSDLRYVYNQTQAMIGGDWAF